MCEPLLLLGSMIERDEAIAAIEPVLEEQFREHREPVGQAVSDDREPVEIPVEDRPAVGPLASELDNAEAVARVVDG